MYTPNGSFENRALRSKFGRQAALEKIAGNGTKFYPAMLDSRLPNSPNPPQPGGFLHLAVQMALSSHMYGDPMNILAAKQSRERRQEAQRTHNTPLPEFPRRWLETVSGESWSPARQVAEALFSGAADERSAPSAARVALEELFKV